MVCFLMNIIYLERKLHPTNGENFRLSDFVNKEICKYDINKVFFEKQKRKRKMVENKAYILTKSYNCIYGVKTFLQSTRTNLKLHLNTFII